MLRTLQADEVRLVCDFALDGEPPEELEASDSIIGQDRAIRALRFGLDIPAAGFNIYVAGARGTGRTTAVRHFLKSVADERGVPDDWCYVNNFKNPYEPKALSVPNGQGFTLAQDIRRIVESAKEEIPEAFQSEDYQAKRQEIRDAFEQQREELHRQLEQQAKAKGFVLQATSSGLFIVPVVDDKPLREQDLLRLDDETRKELREKQRQLHDELKSIQREIHKLQRRAQEAVTELDREVALYVEGQLFAELEEKYAANAGVVKYIQEFRDDLVKNIDIFRAGPESQNPGETSAAEAEWMRVQALKKYKVNVFVDHSDTKGAPVIEELNPTHNNLFGRIEKEARMGALATDFTLVRAGSLHKANGGFLIVPAEDLLRNLFAWEGLKRVLKNQELVIEEASERLGFMATRSLNPEAIPLNLKVVIVGPPELYHILQMLDPDFKELFKVKAEFGTDMECSEANVRKYRSFFHSLCNKEQLPPLADCAVRRMVEYGARLAGDQQKLSTRFADLADIVREAAHYVVTEMEEAVTAEHIARTITEKDYRSNLMEERIQKLISDGTILISTKDAVPGQVNGISVLDLGDFAFGRPSRITATVGLGRQGLIDIEREAKLGGSIHTKGVLILAGYLMKCFGQTTPVSLTGRLVFEQSYGMIDGDSASGAELFALLSALAELPIHQGIAVTGSVNQKGEFQSIGGVNEKIEGVYRICKLQGLSGQQGVLIPEANVRNLMLHEDVVQAIAEGTFHVHACRTVDEGIELLTGVEAGTMQSDGTYPPDSVNGRVQAKLRTMARQLQAFTQQQGEDKHEE